MILRTFSCAYWSDGYALQWRTYLSFCQFLKWIDCLYWFIGALQYFEYEGFHRYMDCKYHPGYGLYCHSLNGVVGLTEIFNCNEVPFTTHFSSIFNTSNVLFCLSLQTLLPWNILVQCFLDVLLFLPLKFRSMLYLKLIFGYGTM